jgi:multicomponent K+:H+ antiporter subunit E
MAESVFTSPGRKSFLQKWLPHPWTTILLMILWLALQNSVSNGNLLIAFLLGITLPLYTSSFWLQRQKIRNPLPVFELAVIVMWDIAVANVQVAWLVLFKDPSHLRSRWVSVPLEVVSLEALTALAAIVSLTPGTISSDFSDDNLFLLVHCLDLEDGDSLIHSVKNRYEKRLKRIFE